MMKLIYNSEQQVCTQGTQSTAESRKKTGNLRNMIDLC